MTHVLTLIAAPGIHDPLAAIADDIRSAIHAAHPPVWLSPDACDISFTPADESALAEARHALRSIPSNAPIDSHIQPVEGRRKRMLAADMDSTIIQQECLDEVARVAGIGPKVAAITERAMRGELQFEAALRERISLLAGFAEAKLQEVLDKQITLMPGARELVATMRASGARTVLVSGGFDFFTTAVAKRAGFDVDYANRFIMKDGGIAGVAEPILGHDAKLRNMQDDATFNGIGMSEVVAIGDGANDLAMLKEAGLGVAFHAKPIVAAEADVQINHNDLTSILYLQGYMKKEFVSE
jgi:phosphoserine phosphatase